MGPLLMTGLACFGAAVGIGLLAAGFSPPPGPPERVARYRLSARALLIILVAFVEGVAVVGIVVGLLAIEYGSVADPSDGLYAAIPALLGALVGLWLVLTHIDTIQTEVALICAMFIAMLAVLSIVVALLALFIVEPDADGSIGQRLTLAFMALGLISGGAALAIGVTGGRAIAAMPDGDEPARRAYRAVVVRRSMPFQLTAIGASTIAIVLVIVA